MFAGMLELSADYWVLGEGQNMGPGFRSVNDHIRSVRAKRVRLDLPMSSLTARSSSG